MNKKTDQTIRILVSLAVAAIFTLVAAKGFFYAADMQLSDAFYQEERAGEADIVIIGIDERAMDILGPWPWSREVLAWTLDYLGSAGDGTKPAVVGVDVLYTGPGSDPEADAHLAEAAANLGNTVFAGAAVFGTSLAEDGENFYLDARSVTDFEEPFPELAANTRIGHINTMEDADAILRHGLLYEEVPGKGRVDALAWIVYEKYCEFHGMTPNPAPETRNGFFYIPFSKEPGGYSDGISIADLLDGSIPPEAFAGRIVLIGPYAPAMQDDYRTAIAHAEPMYGVEIHANLIDAYMRGFFPREVSDRLQLAILFACSAGLLLFFWDRKVLHSLPAWLLVSGLWLVLAKVLYGRGLILHVLWIPLAASVLYAACVVLNYVRAQREKRKVTNTFGHYIDPGVMKQLLEQGSSALELGGKKYDIAVLFVDIRGFTTMSEGLDPPTVVKIINRFLTLTTSCVMNNHGTLDKFVGDCTMAFWNAPVAQKEPVYLACRAAMDMVARTEEFNRAAEEIIMEDLRKTGKMQDGAQPKLTLGFGVGVNFGPAIVGNIGAPQRMDYTAIGDTVNTASRLESNAPAGKILISRKVADVLGERAKVTSLGSSIRLKGKKEGFEVLTLDELL